ncbi:hypothetical protein H8E77_24410 [bacterium]|nr:hypothetical protein [bacterium]
MEMNLVINIGLYARKLMRVVFLAILLLFLAGNFYSQADNPQSDVEGSLCQKIFVAYGPDAKRENAVLYQEHFCDAKGFETGYQEYATEPEDERYGKLQYKEESDYDISGRLSQRRAEVIDPDGQKKSSVYTYIYNEDGKLMEMSTKSTTGPIPITRKYEYDTDGKLIKESYFRGKKLWTYTIFEYDREGHKIKETVYSGEKEDVLESSTFIYNPKGQLVIETNIEWVKVQNTDQWKTTEYTYTYDEQSRLLKKEEEANFGPEEIRNKIFYYEYPPFAAPKIE